MIHHEYELHKAVCKYLSLQYPKVLFLSDTVANVKLNGPQADRNSKIQKKGFKCPDLIIFQPTDHNHYIGLMIELKKETPFYKGQFSKLKKNAHIEEQSECINHLNWLGYFACFAWSFEMAKAIIDHYMSEDIPIVPHNEYFYKYFDR
jgi:hypothetical protein